MRTDFGFVDVMFLLTLVRGFFWNASWLLVLLPLAIAAAAGSQSAGDKCMASIDHYAVCYTVGINHVWGVLT